MRLTWSALTVAVVGTALTAVPAAADVSPPSPVLSHYETDVAGHVVHRDAGYSAPIPGTGTSLWLFGDSDWNEGYWFGTTAAVGPATRGKVPTGLTELLTPPAVGGTPSSRGPSGFLPGFPAGLVTSPDAKGQTHPCTNPDYLPVSWPAGAAAVPNTNRLLVTSADLCVSSGLDERFVLTEYTPSTNTLSAPARVFTNTAGLPGQQQLSSPIFSGGYLYFMSYTCDTPGIAGCDAGQVYLARVQADAAHWQDWSAYRFWTGSSWSPSWWLASSILPGAKPNSVVYAGDFSALGKGFVIVETTSIGGDYRIWRSSSLTSGWTMTRTGRTPCSASSRPGFNPCRALIGHPELSTTSNLMLSYYNPADDHVSMMAVPW
jgi:hypothetical protein